MKSFAIQWLLPAWNILVAVAAIFTILSPATPTIVRIVMLTWLLIWGSYALSRRKNRDCWKD